MKKSNNCIVYSKFCGFVVLDTTKDQIIYQEKKVTDKIGGVQPFSE